MNRVERCKLDLIELGVLGRKGGERVERLEDLSLENGLHRIEGSKQIKESREYLFKIMREAGLSIRIDGAGNIFARKEGSSNDEKAVMCGSHIDSVLNGGMFDGVLGVISALESVRRMNDEGFKNRRPIDIVVFLGEEGSAFKKVLLGSSLFIGDGSFEDAYKLTDEKGFTLKQALIEHDLLGTCQIEIDDMEYFIELHVEQGPVLHREKTAIGIVENITGLTWVSALVKGEENHAGTTPMHMRIDPLVACANIIQFTNNRAKEMAIISGSTVATVGKLVVHPGSPNIIPGAVELGIDIRDTDAKAKKALTEEIINELKLLEGSFNVKTDVKVLFDHPPSALSSDVIHAIKQAAEKAGVDYKLMNSGAGHDAQNLAHKVKTGMIFVPSIDGVSHSPFEWTNWQDIETGVQVLTETLKLLSMK